ncbi:hypothetical protein CYMTET_23088 [Cymbomonas tetramitiformis]|uniref:Endonuclease/exonuclease/phosphatase domain-containing protein n=1 Tax=Cymbomonas tetramitiformis TaxID=36881 RepID=A0AAE0L1A5_9CHLO|nr:hypothetical protein CYMTET_23088 [Cymbomonas tetramitiformis]
MQLATQQTELTDLKVASPRRGGAVPGRRAVLRPLENAAGKENVPGKAAPPPSKGTRTLPGSWESRSQEPRKRPKTVDKENVAPPPEVGDKGRLSLITWNIRGYDHAYDRADVRTNREVPRICIRNYIAQEAAIAARKRGDHLIVGGDFNVAEEPKAQDGAEQVAWRATVAQAGLAEISCPQGPTFGEHKFDGWLASPRIQEIAEGQHPIDTRKRRHCSGHQAAVAAMPLWKIDTATPVVKDEAKLDPATKYQFPISKKALQRKMTMAIESALQPSLRSEEFTAVVRSAVEAADGGHQDAREKVDEAGKAVDSMLPWARWRPPWRLPSANPESEMLAIDRATGEAPRVALLAEAMAEQQEEGDQVRVRRRGGERGGRLRRAGGPQGLGGDRDE